ncbi:MAG: hypothetical protein MK202_02145 [Tenacibaculum sp.]|nr:hypothetical protein [Tenacibaculum sp.]
MKKIITLFILTICTIGFGQNIKKTELIGKWTTNDLIIDFGDTKPKNENIIRELKKGFLNSEFDFRENGKFYIKFPNDKPTFMGELAFLNDRNWKLENNQIKVGTKEDNYNLMHILVQKANGKIYFIIPGMRLEMNKR